MPRLQIVEAEGFVVTRVAGLGDDGGSPIRGDVEPPKLPLAGIDREALHGQQLGRDVERWPGFQLIRSDMGGGPKQALAIAAERGPVAISLRPQSLERPACRNLPQPQPSSRDDNASPGLEGGPEIPTGRTAILPLHAAADRLATLDVPKLGHRQTACSDVRFGWFATGDDVFTVRAAGHMKDLEIEAVDRLEEGLGCDLPNLKLVAAPNDQEPALFAEFESGHHLGQRPGIGRPSALLGIPKPDLPAGGRRQDLARRFERDGHDGFLVSQGTPHQALLGDVPDAHGPVSAGGRDQTAVPGDRHAAHPDLGSWCLVFERQLAAQFPRRRVQNAHQSIVPSHHEARLVGSDGEIVDGGQVLSLPLGG
jgi:hypothetical protein